MFKLHYLVLEDLWKMKDKDSCSLIETCSRNKRLYGGSTTETPEAKTRELGNQFSYIKSARNRHYTAM
jgi:hypothetical protein